jgi:hypothetical protein
LVPPSACELLRGFGIRNLCSTWKSLLCMYKRGQREHRHGQISVAPHAEQRCISEHSVATESDTCRHYSV